jgi:hypothetical protein
MLGYFITTLKLNAARAARTRENEVSRKQVRSFLKKRTKKLSSSGRIAAGKKLQNIG